jgi:protein required for attachment to host cells
MSAWILVSDASRAKLFSAELREDDWSLVQTFEHPEGREPGREIGPTAAPGRMLKSKGPGGRHTALEAHTSPKEAEAERFARQLAGYLEDAVARRQFDYLVLVAPPHFLGVLKGALGRQTTKHVRRAVDKDFSMLDAAEMRERLVDDVFPRHAGSS